DRGRRERDDRRSPELGRLRGGSGDAAGGAPRRVRGSRRYERDARRGRRGRPLLHLTERGDERPGGAALEEAGGPEGPPAARRARRLAHARLPARLTEERKHVGDAGELFPGLADLLAALDLDRIDLAEVRERHGADSAAREQLDERLRVAGLARHERAD